MKISEFLSIPICVDSKVPHDLFAQLTNDFGIPSETVDFLGAIVSEYDNFTETSILYRFSKDSEKIGECLKYLGILVNRIPLGSEDDFGIQEIDVTRPDGYYVLFYLLRELTDNKNK